MAIPLIVEKGTIPLFDQYQRVGYYGRNCVLMFILTADMTLGKTLGNASSGMFGSLLAFGNASLMHWVIPGALGSGASALILFSVAAHSALFVWGVLWLNFGMNTRIFCLFAFAYYLMDFLNPGSPLCRNGAICQPRTGDLVQVAIACGAAVLCTLLPTPVLALGKARADARELSDALARAWLDFGAYFCCAQTSEYQQDKLVADLQKVRSAVQSMEGHLTNSYWEFGWMVGIRGMREHLVRSQRTLQECGDRLFCLWNTCLQDSFASTHEEVMRRMWSHVYKVLFESTKLMSQSVVVACQGSVTSKEERQLQDAAERTRAAVGSLTAQFRELRANISTDNVLEELLDEQSFLLHVCAHGRLAAELAEDFLAHHSRLRPLAAASAPPGIFDRAVLSDAEHLAFTTRGLLTFFVAFVMGCFGGPKAVVVHDAGIAAVTALLLRKSVGAAGARNLQRLRGMAIGTMAGHVAYSLIGWCSWWNHALMLLMLAIWVGTSLFQHSEGRVGAGITHGHISGGASAGMLCAYFGARGMVEQCSNQVYTISDVLGSSYYLVVDSLMAVAICFVAEWALADGTAAQLATSSLDHTWRVLSKALSEALDPRVLEAHSHSVECMHRLRVAEALNLQAEREPRYWRLPWRVSLFADSVEAAKRLRMSLCGLEYCIAEGGRLGAGKAEKVRRLTSLTSFGSVQRVVHQALETIETAVETVLVQETGDTLKALSNPHLKRNFISEYVPTMRSFLREANSLPEVGYERRPAPSLEDDAAAIASALLSCVACIVAEAQTLPALIVQRAIF